METLSDKKSYHSSDGINVRACMCKNWYEEKDVKEFIRKIMMMDCGFCNYANVIKNLVGDALLEAQESRRD